MNSEKTGILIAQLRHAQSMTQKELAEKLGVTDKAVSRWETGRGFPDVGVLAPLAQVLDISITELIHGERVSGDVPAAQADTVLLDVLQRTRRMLRKMTGLLLLLFGIGTVVFRFLYVTGKAGEPMLVLGIEMILFGILLLAVKIEPVRDHSRLRVWCRLCAWGMVMLAFILELLPCGVKMIFAAGANRQIPQSFSYLSLMPYGYGNIFPFTTACLTIMLTMLLFIPCLCGKVFPRLQNVTFLCTVLTVAVAIPAAFFSGCVTLAGIGISVLFTVSAAMQYWGNYHCINQ